MILQNKELKQKLYVNVNANKWNLNYVAITTELEIKLTY